VFGRSGKSNKITVQNQESLAQIARARRPSTEALFERNNKKPGHFKNVDVVDFDVQGHATVFYAGTNEGACPIHEQERGNCIQITGNKLTAKNYQLALKSRKSNQTTKTSQKAAICEQKLSSASLSSSSPPSTLPFAKIKPCINKPVISYNSHRSNLTETVEANINFETNFKFLQEFLLQHHPSMAAEFDFYLVHNEGFRETLENFFFTNVNFAKDVINSKMGRALNVDRS
jgi:hypothetical protein